MSLVGGPYTPDFVEAVRASSDIVQVISDYVPLKRAGRRLKGLCPFHQEKTPSFSVDPDAQLFYCFGCQTGGDIFKFVQLYDKLGFTETLESLAERFHVPIPETRQSKGADERERVLQINDATLGYFRRLLKEDAGQGCRDYLERRGLSAETIEQLELGFSLDEWDGLKTHLAAKRFSPQELLKAGLAVPRKQGNGVYDRFRGRLIFPIRDLRGRVIAFGGRGLAADAQPKYINSPETPAYTKGNHLYGLHRAKEAIRREGFAIVVEGYMDLAALVQHGFDHVVASLGTAFTPAQARLLARYTERVRVSYDGDAAGAQATARSLDMLLDQGFDVHVVDLPGGADPDDFIQQHGASAYERLVREAPEYLQFLVQKEVRRHGIGSTKNKVAVVNAVLPHIAKLKNAIERTAWATKLADTLQIEDGLVLQELQGALKSARVEIRQRPSRPSSDRMRAAEVRLIHLLMRSSSDRQRLREMGTDDLAATAIAPIVSAILESDGDQEALDASTVCARLPEEDSQTLTRIMFRDEPSEGASFDDCMDAFRRDNLTRAERQVASQLNRSRQNDQPSSESEDLDRQLMQLQQLARQRDALH